MIIFVNFMNFHNDSASVCIIFQDLSQVFIKFFLNLMIFHVFIVFNGHDVTSFSEFPNFSSFSWLTQLAMFFPSFFVVFHRLVMIFHHLSSFSYLSFVLTVFFVFMIKSFFDPCFIS